MLERLRRWFRVDDPDVVPFRARFYIFIHSIFAAAGFVLARPDYLHLSAFIGLLFGSMGAASIFWETRLTHDEVKRLVNGIIQSGKHLGLTKADKWAFKIWFGFASLYFLVLFLGLWGLYQNSHDAWKLSGQAQILASVIFLPIIADIYITKAIRRWFFEKAAFLQTSQQRARARFIRRWLQFLGFACLILAGMCQIPLTLFGR